MNPRAFLRRLSCSCACKTVLLIKNESVYICTYICTHLSACASVLSGELSCHGFGKKKEKEKKSCLTSPRHHHLKKHRWAKFLKCLPSENVSGEFCQLRNNNSRYCGVRERSVRGFLISAGCHVWNLTELQERERERERW